MGAEYSNATRCATVKTLFAFYGYVSISVLALAVNTIVLVLSALRVRGDFVLFLANLALADCLFSVVHVVNTLCLNGAAIGHGPLCRRSLDAMLPSFTLMVFALIPIALSRYILLYHRHLYDKLLIKKLAIAYCLLFDAVGIGLTVLAQNMSVSASLRFALIALTVASSLVVVFLSDIAVFRKVSVLVKLALTMHHENRLRIAKQLAITTFLQALQPVLFQVPFIVFTLVHIELFPSLDLRALFELIMLGLAINPLLDGVITLLVVKKYREGVIGISSVFRSPPSRCSFSRRDVHAAECVPMVIIGEHFSLVAHRN